MLYRLIQIHQHIFNARTLDRRYRAGAHYTRGAAVLVQNMLAAVQKARAMTSVRKQTIHTRTGRVTGMVRQWKIPFFCKNAKQRTKQTGHQTFMAVGTRATSPANLLVGIVAPAIPTGLLTDSSKPPRRAGDK